MSTSHVPVRAIQKAGQLLELLASGPKRAVELAEHTGEPRSSVYRMLSSLRELDYVEHGDRRGEFQLGMRLMRLGGAVAARFNVRQAALPGMERLRELTDETVLLYVRRGSEAACVERIDGRWVRLEVVDVGGTLPLHVGAAPPTLLAHAGAEAVEEYLDTVRLEPWTPLSPTTPREVRAKLDEIVHAGVAVSDQDVVLGVASVAAPIRDWSGDVVAAVSVSGMRDGLLGDGRLADTERLVRAAAEEASARLGWLPAESLA